MTNVRETLTERMARLTKAVFDHQFPNAHAAPQLKFPKTFCSACGREFGPGNHGFSHCEDHSQAS